MYRPLLLSVVLSGLLVAAQSEFAAAKEQDEDQVKLVEQPIQEYFSPQIPYTHLGTSCGPIGEKVVWRDSHVLIHANGLAGMWHCLAGLSSEKQRVLDFTASFPDSIRARYQPIIRGLFLQCQLRGTCLIEIKDADNAVLWKTQFTAQDRSPRLRRFAVPSNKIRRAKFLNWSVVDASIRVDRLGLLIEPPKASLRTLAFLVSHAKLARCYDSQQALVKDKAYTLPGQFDCIPTTGMFCLSSAIAARLGIVEESVAVTILRQSHARVGQISRAHGLLPHFVSGTNPPQIAPGTEFSTVDTSLYVHGMLLAAQLLDELPILEQLAAEVEAIDFAYLTRDDGFISHGIRDDGSTLLDSNWADWGGESALVMMLRQMSSPRNTFPPLRSPGRVYQDVGFIAEIQSLFYPQFSEDRADRYGVNWLRSRRQLLARQQAYFDATTPSSQWGIYGLSAGESALGDHYVAHGAAMADIELIHPHYLLMSACIRQRPTATYQTLAKMQDRGMFPPWGMVENVRPDLKRYLAYHGSLNAAFESLAAYHLAAQTAEKDDLIYEAARTCPQTRQAAAVFFRDTR